LLAARCARLALCARRLDRLHQLGLGEGAICIEADVAVAADCERFVAESQRALGRIDTLVCNAGYGFVRPIADTTMEEWDRILRTNLLGTAACIRAAIPAMRVQAQRGAWRGQVMIVSSALARRAKPDSGAYSATKAAQLSIAEALRLELDDAKIAVTSVHPVNTATEFGEVAERVSAQPWRRSVRDAVQTADQVAEAMVRAIVKPRPEVWPDRASRWALGLAGLMPGLVDNIMRRRYGR
ncbi:MAG: SDR family oxidoreductase, partial [Planctomycetes bacterium]|nr:SDR family oxidoreductase [Planctomycetota bacterium]